MWWVRSVVVMLLWVGVMFRAEADALYLRLPLRGQSVGGGGWIS